MNLTKRIAVGVVAVAALGGLALASYSYSIPTFDLGSTQLETNTGDWNPGFFKGECGQNEAVVAISKWNIARTTSNPTGKFFAHELLCRDSLPFYTPFGHGQCRNVEFATGENRGTNPPNDWDFGFFKGECDQDEVVAGVSQTTSAHHIDSILCCKTGPGFAAPDHGPAGCVAIPFGTTQAPSSSGSWEPAPQQIHAECNDSSYIAGVSKEVSGDGAPHKILCCPTPDRLFQPGPPQLP